MKLSLQMHSRRTVDDWTELAQKAEAIGLSEIHIAERLDFPFATWPTLFMMAEKTKKIGLGTGVTNPYSRHPTLTAKMVAMLDTFSQGRAILGIGQGDLWQFDQLGIVHSQPLDALREAVQVIRRLLSGGVESIKGKVFSLPEGFEFPWKSYRDDLPIFVGSRSPGGMAVAGEVADELHLPNCVAPEFVALAQKQMSAGMQRAGRKEPSIPLSSSPQLALSLDREAAVKFAQEKIGAFIEWMDVPRELMGITSEELAGLTGAHRDGDREYLHNNISERYLEAFAVAGTPQDVIQQLEKLADLGLDHITLNEPGPNFDEAMELLDKEVLPHFNGSL